MLMDYVASQKSMLFSLYGKLIAWTSNGRMVKLRRGDGSSHADAREPFALRQGCGILPGGNLDLPSKT
jgi:hypothetical protein